MDKRLLLLLLIVILVAGCTGNNGQIEEANEADIAAEATSDAEFQERLAKIPPTPTKTLIPTYTPRPAEGLDATPIPGQRVDPIPVLPLGTAATSPGPWMVVQGVDSFYMVSEDGSEVWRLPLLHDSLVLPGKWSVPDQGGFIAIAHDMMVDKYLEVRSWPENEVILDLDLLGYTGAPLTFETDFEAEQFELDRHYATGEMAWSGSGELLAFIGSQEGPTPDLYTFDPANGDVAQLTSGPKHAIMPSWSPDDEFIFHAGVESLGIGSSGAGNIGWSFYVARWDGSEVLWVGDGKSENKMDEYLAGWVSAESVLMYSGYWWCGLTDLRKVNIRTGEQTSIWSGQFDAIGYSYPERQALLWVWDQSEETEECGPVQEPGFHLIDIQAQTSEKLEIQTTFDFFEDIAWEDRISSFIGWKGAAYQAIPPSPQLDAWPNPPAFTQNGEWVAFAWGLPPKSLVVEKPGADEPLIDTGEILPINLSWTPDGNRLYYFLKGKQGTHDLWVVSLEDLEPMLVVEGLMIEEQSQPQWVIP